MGFEKHNISTAAIEVGKRFCESCSIHIKNKLQEIDEVRNIKLYPKDFLITFNFSNANKLSLALNTLSDIGYHEKSEINIKNNIRKSFCNCESDF